MDGITVLNNAIYIAAFFMVFSGVLLISIRRRVGKATRKARLTIVFFVSSSLLIALTTVKLFL